MEKHDGRFKITANGFYGDRGDYGEHRPCLHGYINDKLVCKIYHEDLGLEKTTDLWQERHMNKAMEMLREVVWQGHIRPEDVCNQYIRKRRTL